MKNLKIIILIVITTHLCSCGNIKQRIVHFKNRHHIDFVKSNPNNERSARILAVMATTFGKDQTNELYKLLTDSVKKTEDGMLVAKYLESYSNPKVGDKFIDFSMRTPNGDSVRLSDLSGKIVLLEFWSSACKGCVYQFPNLTKTYERFKDKGFEILAVSFDQEKETWINTIQNKQLNWINVSELRSYGNSAGFIYGVSSIPDNFLIDKNGIIAVRDLRGDELDKAIMELIND